MLGSLSVLVAFLVRHGGFGGFGISCCVQAVSGQPERDLYCGSVGAGTATLSLLWVPMSLVWYGNDMDTTACPSGAEPLSSCSVVILTRGDLILTLDHSRCAMSLQGT